MKTTTTILTLLLAGSALAAFAPTAQAHNNCFAEDPATSCGDCNDGDAHTHYYVTGRTYCTSDADPQDPPEELTVCDIYRLVYEIVDDDVAIDIRDCNPPPGLGSVKSGFDTMQVVADPLGFLFV